MELEYLEDLINLTISTEERLLFCQLSKDAAHCPDVHSQTVLFLSKQDFWCSVPEGFDLMRKSFDGKTECSG